MEVEAAITEAVTKDSIRLADPEVEFRLHFLVAQEQQSNAVMVGIEKLKSRKKSFDSIVTWFKSYIPNIVKSIAQEKG